MNSNLTAYLKDHLAGSVAALELMDDLIGSSEHDALKHFLAELKQDVEADQKVLQELINKAGENEGAVRKAGAWLSEKFARAKFKSGGESPGGLGLVQALEMLVLGIRGKELLWRSLSMSSWPPLRNIDLTGLQQRAVEQQQRAEQRRLEAAKAAFG